jgi:hypothetical protein
MSGNIKRRLAKLEGVPRPDPEDERQRKEEQERIRQEAQRINERYVEEQPIERELAWLEGDDLPPFAIAEDGEVRSARDGKPITTFHQTLAEVWYWQEVEWGGPGLIHDEAAETFYTPNGELALSRDRVNLQHYLSR